MAQIPAGWVLPIWDPVTPKGSAWVRPHRLVARTPMPARHLPQLGTSPRRQKRARGYLEVLDDPGRGVLRRPGTQGVRSARC